MKLPASLSLMPGALGSLGVALLLLALLPASAFPPSPPHVIYGTVRNEWGDPLTLGGGQIILETTNGLQLTANIATDAEPGVNYRLTVPLDAGISADLYKPTALRPLVGFRLKVKIGQTIYLPMQMTGSFANLGKPAQSTRLDLTLGEDSDGDGLPDAWERLLIAMLGGNLTLADIRPGDDSDGDGISNYAEYLAGTYPWDSEDGFRLALVGGNSAAPLLEFLTLSGRSYTLQTSTNLQSWSAAQFRIPAQGPNGLPMSSYRATGASLLRVEPVLAPGVPAANYFFRARVQ
jgi:hypothetical protein